MTTIKLIHGLTELAEVAAIDDELPIYDLSAVDTLRISRLNLLGYKEYVALVSQSGTNAPTATIIKNDTGATVTWAYLGSGSYSATFSSPVLVADKTIGIVAADNYSRHYSSVYISISQMNIFTATAAGIPANSVLSSTPVIIRIYQ